MNLDQYIGCVILWKGRKAAVVSATDCYEGTWFTLEYDDGSTVRVDAFDDALMDALPDPEYGILKYRDLDVVFLYKDTEYELGDHPYEPCLYIRKDGKILHTLHNAFTVEELPERLMGGETLLGIDGKPYGYEAFCKVLAITLDSGRSEMDFPYAAGLVK